MSDGEITFSNVTGGTFPFEFSIDDGITYFSDSVFDNLSAGAYDLKLRDDSGCTSGTIQLTVTEPITFTATAIETQGASCFSSCDASLTVNVSNEPTLLSSLAYDLNGIIQFQNPTFNNLCGFINHGYYFLTVTDANNCVAYDTISQPLLKVRSIEIVDPKSPAKYFPPSTFIIQSFCKS